MNRDPRFALGQEVEAKQTLLDQLRALAADDPGAALGVDHLRAARGGAAASSRPAADAALPRPLGPRNYLQASGAGLWRLLHGHCTEAGTGRRRFAKPRLGYTRAADLLEAGHAARAGVARGHPYGPHPCRRDRMARPALPFPLPGR